MITEGKITRLHDYMRVCKSGHRYMGRDMWFFIDRIARFVWSERY